MVEHSPQPVYHTRLSDFCHWLPMFRSRIALILLPLLLLAGCGPDKDSPVYQRKQAFKQMMRHKEAMFGMLSGRIEYEPKRFAAEMAQLQQASLKPWPLFTELKGSHAKQEVLLEPAAFKQSQTRLERSLASLGTVVATLPAKPDELRAPFKAVTDSCQACHDRFRIE